MRTTLNCVKAALAFSLKAKNVNAHVHLRSWYHTHTRDQKAVEESREFSVEWNPLHFRVLCSSVHFSHAATAPFSYSSASSAAHIIFCNSLAL